MVVSRRPGVPRESLRLQCAVSSPYPHCSERTLISQRYTLTLSDIADTLNWHFCQGGANFAKVFIGITLRARILKSVPFSVPRRIARSFLCALSHLCPWLAVSTRGQIADRGEGISPGRRGQLRPCQKESIGVSIDHLGYQSDALNWNDVAQKEPAASPDPRSTPSISKAPRKEPIRLHLFPYTCCSCPWRSGPEPARSRRSRRGV